MKLLLTMLSMAVVAAAPSDDRAAQLAGTWSVDLRVKLDDPPYSQPMTLAVDGDGIVTGSFYQSDILAGRAGTAQDRTCIAFRTTDGQGMYHTSACLADGKLVGQTWAEGRGFVLPWTATRS